MTTIEILLVEDNPHDALFTREALAEGRIANRLYTVPDGFDCIQYLKKETPYQNAVRPHLILLDLNMPNMGGLEVLEIIKNDDDLKKIPVVVFTSSDEDADVVQAYDHHVNAYVKKPLSPLKFIEAIHQIKSFWLSIVILPE